LLETIKNNQKHDCDDYNNGGGSAAAAAALRYRY